MAESLHAPTWDEMKNSSTCLLVLAWSKRRDTFGLLDYSQWRHRGAIELEVEDSDACRLILCLDDAPSLAARVDGVRRVEAVLARGWPSPARPLLELGVRGALAGCQLALGTMLRAGLPALASLARLRLERCDLGERGVEAAICDVLDASAATLVEFGLVRCSGLTDAGRTAILSTLCTCKGLAAVNLQGSHCSARALEVFFPPDPDAPSAPEALHSLVLDLGGTESSTEGVLAALCDALPRAAHVREWALSECHSLTLRDVGRIAGGVRAGARDPSTTTWLVLFDCALDPALVAKTSCDVAGPCLDVTVGSRSSSVGDLRVLRSANRAAGPPRFPRFRTLLGRLARLRVLHVC